MVVDGIYGFLMFCFVVGQQGKVICKRQRGNGSVPNGVSELWVIGDGFDDGIEDPDEDDGAHVLEAEFN